MAWGYWLSSAFGNVAFAVLIMQILSYFFPIFGNGQNWPGGVRLPTIGHDERSGKPLKIKKILI
jgi:amino acid transporter